MVLSIGFIGAGGIASVHLDTLEEISNASASEVVQFDDVDLVAVADLDEKRAQIAADPHDATVYTDGKELITCEPLDALILTVPPFAHGDYERLAANYEMDLFIEKPIGLSMDEVMDTASHLENIEIIAQTGYVCRYGQITERALDLLGNRSIGHIASVYWASVPDTSWWTERASSGGQLVEQSTHAFDLHRYLAGEVMTVTGSGTKGVLVDDVDFHDSTSVTLLHESDTVSHISSTCASPSTRFEVRIVAENAYLELDYLNHSITGVVDGESIQFEGNGEWYAREFKMFLEAVKQRGVIRSDYSSAVQTLELTLAAREAVETGNRVSL